MQSSCTQVCRGPGEISGDPLVTYKIGQNETCLLLPSGHFGGLDVVVGDPSKVQFGVSSSATLSSIHPSGSLPSPALPREVSRCWKGGQRVEGQVMGLLSFSTGASGPPTTGDDSLQQPQQPLETQHNIPGQQGWPPYSTAILPRAPWHGSQDLGCRGWNVASQRPAAHRSGPVCFSQSLSLSLSLHVVPLLRALRIQLVPWTLPEQVSHEK